MRIHHTGRDGIKAQNADGLLIEHCEIASTGVRDPGNARWGRRHGIDPRLDAAALYRPSPGSPALDAGETVAGVTSDYSGAPRLQGSASDIGAHEGAAGLLVPPTGLRVVKE